MASSSCSVYRDVMEACRGRSPQARACPSLTTPASKRPTPGTISAFGTRSIEHWYGIPDAAIPDGVQNFPAGYNYNNETDRFRYAGHLWREADPKRLQQVLAGMVKAQRGLGSHARHLRSQPRPAARAEPALVPRLSAPRAGIIFPPQPQQPRFLLPATGLPPTRPSGRRTTASGWPPCAISNASAA